MPEEVVVTAQKRSQRLQHVPIAISVVDQAQLRRQQVNTIADLARTSPALEINDAAPGGGGQIRGIGTQSFTPSAEASVGVVVDGVPQGNVNINNIFDVQRVEILRGPQGMLFGQSTSAGVINLVTFAPDPTKYLVSLHTEIAPEFLGSRFSTQLAQAVVNLPLAGNSALRLSGFGNFQQGLYHDNYTGKDNSAADVGVRGRYMASPADNVTINLIADFDRRHTFGYSLFAATTPLDPQSNAALASCGVRIYSHNQDNCSNYANQSVSENYGASAQIDWTVLGHTITSISSYRRNLLGPSVDDTLGFGPSAPVTILDPLTKSSGILVQQELRLASPTDRALDYIAGLFYSDYQADVGGLPSLLVLPFGNFPSGNISTTKISSEAVFGQATYHLLPALRLIAGARFTHERLYDNETIYGQGSSSGAATENNLSWRFGAQYDVQPNLMAYATVTRGYKGPQVNDTLAGVPSAIIQPEIPLDYEVGVKGTTLHNRLGVDLNLFHSNVKNYQGQSCIITPQLVCGPTNVPQVLTQGVELDVFGRPLTGLTVNAGFIYNPVKYPAGYLASDGTNLGGTQLTNAPEYKLTISTEYVHDLWGQQAYVDLDATHRSKDSLYPTADPAFIYPAHWIVGGKIGLRSNEGRWGAALFVRNLFDQAEPGQLFANNPGVLSIWAPTSFRTVGVSLDARF